MEKSHGAVKSAFCRVLAPVIFFKARFFVFFVCKYLGNPYAGNA